MKKIIALTLSLLVIFSCFSIVAYAAPGDNLYYEEEPNNSMYNADLIEHDDTYQGTVTSGDVDYYRFTITEYTTFAVVMACSFSTTTLTLVNSNNEFILSCVPQRDSNNNYTSSWSGYFSPGTYYIKITETLSFDSNYLLYFLFPDKPTHTHSYTKISTVSPTCGEDGYDLYECDYCGEEKKDNYVDATGNHNTYLYNSYDASCGVAGYELWKCRNCDYQNKVTTSPALEHDYTYYDSEDATCEEDGYELWKCEYCGDEDKRTTETATGHDFVYSYTVEEATCYSTGLEIHECSNCYEEKEVVLPKTDHLDLWFIKSVPSTCKVQGYDLYECIDCDKTIKKNLKPLAGHNYKKTGFTAATMSAPGSTGKEACSVCGAVKTYASTIAKISTVTLSATSYTYNGSVFTPGVTVKDANGKTLVKDKDFSVSYSSGRKNPGKYTVTVTFKGNYSGTKKLTFTVKPKTTSVSSASSSSSSSIKVKWSAQKSLVSGYQIQYATNSKFSSAKTVTVSGGDSASKTLTGLKAKTKYYVRIRAYKSVDGEKIYSAWSSAKSVTTKVAVSIKMSAKTATVYVGATKTLKCTAVPSSVTVKWKSSDSKIAKVSSSGKVTAVKAGTATITAYFKYDGKTYKATTKVTVKKPSISLSKSSVTLNEGSSTTVNATIKPTSGTVKWTTSNSKVATVSSSGKITAKSKGTATITATLSYKGKTYKKTCKVTVNKVNNFSSLVSYINRNGYTDSDGNRYIGFKQSDSEYTYTYTITYNRSTGKLDFEAFSAGRYTSSIDQLLVMSLGPNSTVIDVKNILGTNYSNSSGSYLTRAVAYGTVDKRTYYDGMMVDFSWASGSSSSLANYKGEELCSKFLRLGMLAWDIALMQEWGKGLNALGFVNL